MLYECLLSHAQKHKLTKGVKSKLYYYFNYGFSAVSLLCLYTLLVLFMGNWFAYSKAYGTV